jgi:ribosome-binding protein aMBF1 (putative translation factor)
MTPKKIKYQQPDTVKKLYIPPKDVIPEHKEFIKRIGDRLKQIRDNQGISASQVARESKLSRNLYHQIEHGRVYFTISSLLRVLDVLKITASDFFKGL